MLKTVYEPLYYLASESAESGSVVAGSLSWAMSLASASWLNLSGVFTCHKLGRSDFWSSPDLVDTELCGISPMGKKGRPHE